MQPRSHFTEGKLRPKEPVVTLPLRPRGPEGGSRASAGSGWGIGTLKACAAGCSTEAGLEAHPAGSGFLTWLGI